MERIENYRREDYESHKSSTEMSAHKVEDHDSDYITTASPNSSKSATPDGIQDEREQHLTENREQVFVALESLGVINLKVNSFDHLLNCRDNDSDTNGKPSNSIKKLQRVGCQRPRNLTLSKQTNKTAETGFRS